MINAKEVTATQAFKYIALLAEGVKAANDNGKNVRFPAVYLEGEPGVGKTTIARELAKMLNFYLIIVSANQRSPDDVIGVQMPNPQTGRTEWYPPTWLPSADGSVIIDGHKYDGTLIFFDELASADDRVRKPLFGAFLDGVINDFVLPKNAYVLAAGNEADTGTMVFEFDNATRLRFMTLRITAELKSWLVDFAAEHETTPSVVATLRNQVGIFCETKEALEKGQELYGSPRGWTEVSDQEKFIMLKPEHRTDELRLAALEAFAAGKVGLANAQTYMATFSNLVGMTDLLTILEADAEGRDLSGMWPDSLDRLYALSFSMMAYPKTIEEGQQIYSILDKAPEGGEVPISESKTAIQEAILQRLRARGFKSKDLEVFSAANRKTVAALGSGPVIKIAI
ncbi:AAA family ATPase [Croceicoccus gelatinilyticus]|uniref:AAA family ATPase n=1 Tax=Croceicoccus gelatinilyticus TaxID=2835536 RepID=UPI001BCFB8A0|nr:AAA family ATPase [Croceicoccus gelatinilyticus]MBS7671727.1 AAA family ATPase [Croceicoccus gelatinilyticus]